MPRGVRKTVSTEEQLRKINEQIAALQEQREQLLEKKKDGDSKKLVEFLAENQINFEDAKRYLTTAIAASKESSEATQV